MRLEAFDKRHGGYYAEIIWPPGNAYEKTRIKGGEMSEQILTEVMMPILGALVIMISTLLVWFTKQAISYLNKKAERLGLDMDADVENRIQQKVQGAISDSVLATHQTFVRGLKKRAKDGQLTTEEAKQALEVTLERALHTLKGQGIETSRDLLRILIESNILRLKEYRRIR